MTDNEKKLLRQQAEAYAFVYDLRRTALANGDGRYIRLTEGVDSYISKRQKEYPTLFKRYFNEALKRADVERMKAVTKNNVPPVVENGERKKITQRETKAQEKSKEKDRLGSVGHLPSGRAPTSSRKKKKRPRKKQAIPGGIKSGPE